MNTRYTPLRHLYPGWFAVVMGLCGLSLAWHRASGLMGSGAAHAAMALGLLAAAVFAVLAVAMLWRIKAWPQAWAEDCQHPVRHTFIAAIPVGMILLATVAVALTGPNLGAEWLWMLGAATQALVTWWVLSRWLRGKLQPGAGAGMNWATMTPALFIPVVGNVLVPLAGVPLGHGLWAAAQFGVGVLFWPVVWVLILVRLGLQGEYPARLLPANFVFIAPPAVVGLGALQFGAPAVLVHMLWGMALFSLAWALSQGRRIAALPFGLPHWGMSFPLAALAALSLRLAESNPGMAPLAIALLALASVVIAWLLVATLRGLRDGSLLAPEPVAAIAPAAA